MCRILYLLGRMHYLRLSFLVNKRESGCEHLQLLRHVRKRVELEYLLVHPLYTCLVGWMRNLLAAVGFDKCLVQIVYMSSFEGDSAVLCVLSYHTENTLYKVFAQTCIVRWYFADMQNGFLAFCEFDGCR